MSDHRMPPVPELPDDFPDNIHDGAHMAGHIVFALIKDLVQRVVEDEEPDEEGAVALPAEVLVETAGAVAFAFGAKWRDRFPNADLSGGAELSIDEKMEEARSYLKFLEDLTDL